MIEIGWMRGRGEAGNEDALVLNRSPIIFKNLQIKSKSVKEGMNPYEVG